ncbi:MAG TPA: TIGR00296 family protein [Thermoplasmata archaeon]|nr:TIGR00296 family protein [Thermoplasmata archaeon]
METRERELAVRLARRSLEAAVRGEDRAPTEPLLAGLPAVFAEPRGVFVTLTRHPSEELRGCIGFPLPTYPLGEALQRAAAGAALEDPRFPPVRPPELDRISLEVSVLTSPEPIGARGRGDLPARIQVGRDGLVVEGLGSSGLLLPQVAPEQGWDAAEFLSETCRKAGLRSDAWLDLRVQVFRFQAEVFGEERPNGPVVPHAPVPAPHR